MNPKFLFISKSDLYGGASLAGYRLHKTLCSNGYLSKMVVLNKIAVGNARCLVRLQKLQPGVHSTAELEGK